MKITVKVGSWASECLSSPPPLKDHFFLLELDLPKDATVREAALMAGIPAEKLGISVIEDRVVRQNFVLSDGDTVALYPPIIGG